jgi:hypothetical protein
VKQTRAASARKPFCSLSGCLLTSVVRRDSGCACTTGSESVFATERVPPTQNRREGQATLRHPEGFGPGP